MITSIKKSKVSKVVAVYLALQLVITTIQPSGLWALTGGPSQPEFNSFTPIGTSDMVSLTSGDFSYNIPVMDVGGYPLNLAYNSGITMDEEASWVGLGWNLNVGQINRQVRGLPDDFDGDEMTYQTKMKPNKTVGTTLSINGQLVGNEQLGLSGNASATLQFNNYEGFSFTPSFGLSYKFCTGTSVGMNITSSVDNGASVTPTASQSFDSFYNNTKNRTMHSISSSVGIGIPFNSRQGITAFNINTSSNRKSTRARENQSGGWDITYAKSGGSTTRGISFIDNTFTPSKRMAYDNENYTFTASLGFNVGPLSFEGGVSAFYTLQKLNENEDNRKAKAFGYEFTENATHNDVLDFNRENERIASKRTLTLPTANYTYDIYNINGQGIGGQFRPYKSQVGYLFGQKVEDNSDSFSLGGEFEGGWGFHAGIDLEYSPTTSRTGVWNVPVLNKFKPSQNNEIDYEETYYKVSGDLSVDDDQLIFEDDLHGESPMALDLYPDGNQLYGKKPIGAFKVKDLSDVTGSTYTDVPIQGKIKRQHREKRNIAVQKITKAEAVDNFITPHVFLQNHHTNGYKILQPDGSTYVYGEAAVNTTKNEVTFSTNKTPDSNDLLDGTITPNTGEDGMGNNAGFDNFYNNVRTPAYAHTYLLTSVLSSDYEDLTGNGPTDDDLGAYTKVTYYNPETNYNWRVPYGNKATYNPGLYTKGNDQKANYVSGTKELKYVSKIETKTHVALFDLSERQDARGVGSSGMLQLDSIRLYSKPEYEKLLAGDNTITPIKTAHFEYTYDLVKGTPNGSVANGNGKLTLDRLWFTYRGSKMGKYTPYVFNYENPNPEYQIKSYDVWGNYKPIFDDYNVVTPLPQGSSNPTDFQVDVSVYGPGGSNELNASCEANNPVTSQEFPFVKQDNKALQDLYVSAWTLSSIDLPSGGKIELEFESDDYKYVQDKEAMQMFKVIGVTHNGDNPDSINNKLYGDLDSTDNNYLAIELLEPLQSQIYNESIDNQIDEFIDKYLGEHIDKPIYYKFLLNMEMGSSCSKDYVEGYVNIANPATPDIKIHGDIALIKIETQDMEGGVSGNNQVNPIAKAGWYFARKNLNRYAYGTGDDEPNTTNLGEIVNGIFASIDVLAEIFTGPNQYLRNRHIAKYFNPDKSWIRLKHPTNAKLGGGLRVKTIKMYDNWDIMVNQPQTDVYNPYSNFYGQEYSYQLEDDLGSSGVATWEPNMSKENPHILPFYDNKDRLQAHDYVEKPFGKSFFPAATVTYSRVEVKNLSRIIDQGTETPDDDSVVKNNATGKVVNTFYTSKDFPTIADHTKIDSQGNYVSNADEILDNILKLNVNTELVLSQGFSVITNDMNGKPLTQEVYNENDMPVSSVKYIYNVDDNGRLDNNLPVILENGSVSNRLIGTHYDVITDFNESYNNTEVHGVHVNTNFFIIPTPIPIPILLAGLPYTHQKNTAKFRSTTTTKVVHKTGILVEKIATDLGSTVKTKNLAWDAVSGQVLLTETINEYEDDYYNFSYPAHWMYPNMGQAVKNLGLELLLQTTPSNSTTQGQSGDEEGDAAWYTFSADDYSFVDLETYLDEGDEVFMYNYSGTSYEGHYWVNEILNNRIIFTDRNGDIVNPCGDDESSKLIKVIRSANRNLQSASMASVTTMVNPFVINPNGDFDETNYANLTASSLIYNGTGNDPRIINSSAVEYEDFWRPQGGCDDGSGVVIVGRNTRDSIQNNNDCDQITYPDDTQLVNDLVPYPLEHTNPFVNNIKGDWRAVKSYAYLTGRSNNGSPRNDGFFTSFNPFYQHHHGGWLKNTNNWTFASEVSKYSPYGAELENKDALDRYSAAQYGYNYTLPVAVASNSAYKEIGFDGFEDYSYAGVNTGEEHFSFKNALTNGVTITSETAHTGRHSIKVPSGETASLQTRDADLCEFDAIALDCAPEQEDNFEIIGNVPTGCPISCNAVDLNITNNGRESIDFSYNITLNSGTACQTPPPSLTIFTSPNNQSSGTFIVNSGQVLDISIGSCVSNLTANTSDGVLINIVLSRNGRETRRYSLPVCDDVGCN